MTQENIEVQMVKAREEYINLIKAELLGPGSEFSIPDAEHELISSLPTSRYSIGILYPQHCMNQDNAETIEININNADEENQEEIQRLANCRIHDYGEPEEFIDFTKNL